MIKDLAQMRYLIALIVCAYSVPAFGSDDIDRTEINKALKNVQSKPLKHNGKDGVWFSKEDAAILLEIVQVKFKKSLDVIDNQNTQINALKSAVEGYKLSNKSYLNLSNLHKKMFDTTMKHLPDMIPEGPSWYESPEAMFFYGAVVGAVVVFGTTYLATRALGEK